MTNQVSGRHLRARNKDLSNHQKGDISMRKRSLISMGLMGIAILLILTPFTLHVTAKEGSKTESDWVWTKEIPKPSWWIWDKTYFPSEPVRGGVLHSANTRYIGLMNPHHWPVNDWATLSLIYDRLIYTDGENRPVVPWLAKSWKYENDVTILMKLRQGVTFHDGSLFNAHGLKYQIDWIKDRKNGAWSRNWIKLLDSIEVVDDYTVRWHLKEKWAGFFDIFANVPGYVISAKALKADVALGESKRLADKLKLARKRLVKAEKRAKKAASQGGEKAKKAEAKVEKAKARVAKLTDQLKEAKELAKGAVPLDARGVGSGPYMVEEAREGNYIKLKRNPNWWFGKTIGKPDMPYFDGHKVTVIPETSVQLANLKAGKIDTLGVDKSQYDQVKNDPNLRVWLTPLSFTTYLAFNHHSGPFKDILMRKAVSHAIDRKALIAANERGFGRVASCFFPEDHFAHNPNLKFISYDPELSKRLMAEAGYPKGLKVKGLIYSDSASMRFGQIIKAMLKRVNIDYELEATDPVSYMDRLLNLEFDATTIVAIYIRDPDSSITTHYHMDPDSDRPRRTDNKEAIALIEAARKELDYEKRVKIYHDIEKVLYDNYEDAWLYHFTYLSATRKRVLGYNREMDMAGGDAYWPTHPRWFKDGKRH